MKKISQNLVSVYLEPPELKGDDSKSDIWVEREDFYCAGDGGETRKSRTKSIENTPYLILGFDTEFKSPEESVTSDQIKLGDAKYKVLSYQFHAKTSEGQEWSGICCPKDDERLTVSEFVVFALGLGSRVHEIKNLPTKIFMVGHFTRADIPAFADFRDLTDYLSSVRNTFLSIDKSLKFNFFEDDPIEVDVILRDTMLLTPQASKSLRGIGELVGVEKIVLSKNKKKAKELISNMDQLRSNDWELFKEYALNDALICVRYIEEIIKQYESVTGKKKVPVTLTSIGVDLLLNSWNQVSTDQYLKVLGREKKKERFYNKAKGYYSSKTTEVPLAQVHFENAFVTESYHGGRNEQFWFGPCFEDDWTDFDLSGAYPTVMSLIGMPDWESMYETKKLKDFQATTLGFAWVEFEFPKSVRYPTLPVRTDHGLIFPIQGVSYCSSPEIVVARNLGAKLKIKRGLIIPSNDEIRVFEQFIEGCVLNRKKEGSKTLKGLFWKEISNSTYGKTAQGLREKRVYDLRDKDTKVLPESRITNPYFASFITSYTRGLLGEIMNGIDADSYVFSCTTDGFLTNATDAEMKRAEKGELASLFKKARKSLTGQEQLLEVKHRVRLPLGWKTRGQATLMPGSEVDESMNTVLAKGGIFTKPESEETSDQNDDIVRMFFERSPQSLIRVESLTGMRDIVENDADLVSKVFYKRLNMEYDWKRQPKSVGYSKKYKHVIFSTRPWYSEGQFVQVRKSWEEYVKDSPSCIKDLNSFNSFASYLESTTALPPDIGRYLHKEDGDLKRLRQSLCSAWKHSQAGLSYQKDNVSAQSFADLLNDIGIPCKKSDVENSLKKAFHPNIVPPTEVVKEKLRIFKKTFKKLDESQILFLDTSENAVTIRKFSTCDFVSKCD